MDFQQLMSQDIIRLYAGDIVPRGTNYNGFIGLSLRQENSNHIKFDLQQKFPLLDSSVDVFQSEDVFEHLSYESVSMVINEIYRVLKPNGLFRLSLPDYNCDILYKRSLCDHDGNIVFDPNGGGTLEKPGHLWFPVYENVKNLLDQTLFSDCGKIDFLHYYVSRDKFITRTIDYNNGYIARTPDHDPRVKKPYRPMSIVVDCFK